MLNPIIEFVARIFQWIGRAVGMLIAWLCWPFMLAGRWYTRSGWIVRIVVGLVILVLIGLYANFFWQTQRWTNFDPDYALKYGLKDRQLSAGEPAPALASGATQKTCARSAIGPACRSASTRIRSSVASRWTSAWSIWRGRMPRSALP